MTDIRDEKIVELKKRGEKSLKGEAGGVTLCLSAFLLLGFPSIIGILHGLNELSTSVSTSYALNSTLLLQRN